MSSASLPIAFAWLPVAFAWLVNLPKWLSKKESSQELVAFRIGLHEIMQTHRWLKGLERFQVAPEFATSAAQQATLVARDMERPFWVFF